MKKIYSKKVFDLLCKKTKNVRDLSSHNWESFSDYNGRVKTWCFYGFNKSIMESDINFLKRAMVYEYRVKNRCSKIIQDMILNNEFNVSFYSGYNLFFVNSDNSVSCADCFKKEIVKAYGEYHNVNFVADNCDNNYEDTSLYCDCCQERIQSAYCEDDIDSEDNQDE